MHGRDLSVIRGHDLFQGRRGGRLLALHEQTLGLQPPLLGLAAQGLD